MANDTRTCYIVQASWGSPPRIVSYPAIVTAKRVAVGAPGDVNHYRADEFVSSYAWTPAEAWAMFIKRTQEKIASLRIDLAEQEEYMRVALARAQEPTP